MWEWKEGEEKGEEKGGGGRGWGGRGEKEKEERDLTNRCIIACLMCLVGVYVPGVRGEVGVLAEGIPVISKREMIILW